MTTKGNGHHKEESLIQFPCDFMIKIMGNAEGEFENIALSIIRAHFPEISHIEKKLSKNKKYLSLSVTVYTHSKTELDALYRDLSGHKEILMVL